MLNYKKKKDSAITVKEALKASGVLEISASYFGLKFCYYGLMMWLPLYVRTTENNSQ
jgi:sugar phosphate permease